MAHALSKVNVLKRALTSQDVRLKRDVKDMSFFYGAATSAFMFIGVLFIYLWCRLVVVNTGYEISKANSARDGLIEENRRLRIELVALKSPERIERIAREELNLARPQAGQTVSIQ